MYQIELGTDDFHRDSKFVKIGNVLGAIARVLLLNGSRNKFQAERDAWPHIHTGIVAGKLHPLDPETLALLSSDNSGGGIVLFDELVEWGKWGKRFDFVVADKTDKQTDNPSAGKAEDEPGMQTEAPKPPKSWLIADQSDTEPDFPWYVPARYFARRLVKDDSTLLTKRDILAGKVVQSLTAAGIYKRGGKKPFSASTVLKAFANISLG